ncbi:MAG: ATP-binding cassette domain-containing protein, partial [Gammaproteobacteria bacterium]|nr:ATP-binding cassette domain-containing protein [Gammaproteobacteria bacterium]
MSVAVTTPPPAPAPLLEVRELAKSFGANRVLEDVSFALFPGDCLAVCGENGAGKSTLIKALTAIHAPTRGQIRWRDQAVRWTSPQHSAAAGLAAAHQEFSTLDALSVAENIYLGNEPRTRWRLLDRRRMNADAKALLDALGIPIEPGRQLARLSVAERQMVEIAKALRQDPQALILDEPTAV